MSVIVLLLVLLTLGVLGQGFARGRAADRRVERAGVSPDRPGCARCLYPLGGWSSPRCPECGADIDEVGVREHSDGRRRRRAAIVMVLGVWIGLPLFGFTVAFLLDADSRRITTDAVSERDGDLRVLMAAERAWSRVPPRSHRVVSVELFDLADASGPVSILNGRPTGMTGVRTGRLEWEDPSPPERAALMAEVRDALQTTTAGRLAEAELDRHADAIATTVDGAFRPPSGTGPNAQRPVLGSPFVSGGWGVQLFGSGPWRTLATIVLTVLGTTALVAGAMLLVRRRTPDGHRAAAPGEWATASAAA